MRHLLTPAIEDYLKVIYNLQQQGTPGTKLIAEEMNISSASVTNMLKRLDTMGLATYTSHRGVTLTSTGERVALEIIRHHRLLELYLSEVMGYSWDEVHDEAELLEHHISEYFEDTIDQMLGSPRFDPHGDPIPTKDGRIPSTDSDTLLNVEAERHYVIHRVSDQTPELLRYLAELGLKPNCRVELLSKAPFNGPVTLKLNTDNVIIGTEVAGHIHVVEEHEFNS